MKSFIEFIAEDRLSNDILSLKRIGWSLDKVTKHLITKTDDYGKLTSDQIASIYSPPKPAKAPKVKIPKHKEPKWPKDPPKSKINDSSHAEGYIAQAIESDESPDMTGEEMYTLLDTAGYTKEAIIKVLINMGQSLDNRFKKTHGITDSRV